MNELEKLEMNYQANFFSDFKESDQKIEMNDNKKMEEKQEINKNDKKAEEEKVKDKDKDFAMSEYLTNSQVDELISSKDNFKNNEKEKDFNAKNKDNGKVKKKLEMEIIKKIETLTFDKEIQTDLTMKDLEKLLIRNYQGNN